MRKILFLLFMICGTAYSQNAADRDPDFNVFPLPQGNYFINGSINSAALLPDGKILILDELNVRKLITLDNNIGYDLGAGLNGEVQYYAIQPDGKILVNGNFTTLNGNAVGKMTRINPDGSHDNSFSISAVPDFEPCYIAVQPDGKILLNLSASLVRLNSDGSLDTTFTATVTNMPSVRDILFQSDGKILVCGYFREGNQYVNRFLRFNMNGTIDAAFNVEGDVSTMAIQPDGKILVSGYFGNSRYIRLNVDGSRDTTFMTGFAMFGADISDSVVQPNGKIIVGGSFTSYFGDTSVKILLRLNPDGSLDPTFASNSAFKGGVSSLVQKEDGKIFVGGYFTYNNVPVHCAVLLNPDGTRAMEFNNRGAGFDNSIYALAVQPDNKIIAGGNFSSYNDVAQSSIIRLNPDGSPDGSFITGGGFTSANYASTVSAIQVLPDAKILISGDFDSYNGTAVDNLVRLNANGALDETFVNTSGLYSRSVTVQPDGKIIIVTNRGVQRLNANGTPDAGFTLQNFNIATIQGVTLQPDGKILICGQFTQSSIPINGMARLDANGQLDNSFLLDPSLPELVFFDSGVQLQPDGKILVFAFDYGKVIRLNNNGSLDPTFNDQTPLTAEQKINFQLLPDGKIIVYTENVGALYRLNQDGSLDETFENGKTTNGTIAVIALQPDGKLVLGGSFTEYGSLPENRIVRLIGEEFNTVSGTNNFDADNNGCMPDDPVFTNLNFQVSGSVNTNIIANGTGNFSYLMKAGQYTFTPTFENPEYFAVEPTSVSVDFPAQGSLLHQDFCVTSIGQYSDLQVTLIPATVARPGFDATYIIAYKNKGNQSISGTAILQFDDAVMDLVSSNPVAAQQIQNMLSWNFSQLQPFESRSIVAVFNLNRPNEIPRLIGGEVLNFSANVTSSQTDQTPSDNSFVLHETVVNSYDPNDKTCLEGATIGTEKIGDYVHYLIRFENKGTYAAQNITVADLIDLDKFDISSLKPLVASHLFITKITGNKVEFIFDNINLPFNDANNDGYVAFKIKTKPTLSNGDTFSNTASIYFDYNFPVVTNTATTTIAALSNNDFEFRKYFVIYPNPATDFLMIQNKQKITLDSIEIYNVTGQRVLVVPNAKGLEKFDVSGLKTGSYFLKIYSEKGTSNVKFLKK